MAEIWIELYRLVADFDDDFDACRESTFTARQIRRYIRDELEEADVRDVYRNARRFEPVNKPEFLEFDSGRSHACGYWALCIRGPQRLVDAIQRARDG